MIGYLTVFCLLNEWIRYGLNIMNGEEWKGMKRESTTADCVRNEKLKESQSVKKKN